MDALTRLQERTWPAEGPARVPFWAYSDPEVYQREQDRIFGGPAGFVVDRIAGSHHVMTFPGDPTRTVTVPVKAGRDLKPGTLRSIIRQAGLTVEEFNRLL